MGLPNATLPIVRLIFLLLNSVIHEKTAITTLISHPKAPKSLMRLMTTRGILKAQVLFEADEAVKFLGYKTQSSNTKFFAVIARIYVKSVVPIKQNPIFIMAGHNSLIGHCLARFRVKIKHHSKNMQMPECSPKPWFTKYCYRPI